MTTGTGRRYDPETETLVAHTLRSADADTSEDKTGRGVPLVAFDWTATGAPSASMALEHDHSPTLKSGAMMAVGFHNRQDPDISGDVTHPLGEGDNGLGVQAGGTVRRLMPAECERLQGFPDGWTLVPYRGKPAADGPRYAAIGNSMACNVMRWVGRRIALVDALVPA